MKHVPAPHSHYRYENTLDFARSMDAQDPFARFRERFHLPLHVDGEPKIYFCGNSLGLQPKIVREYLMQELDDWATLGVEGHFHAKHPWMPYHEFLTGQTARLVGAKPVEVVVMNTLTVNLHLLMVSFYRPTADRYKILIEASAFPSDLYAVQSQTRFHGFDPEDAVIAFPPRDGEDTIRTSDLEAFLDEHGSTVALVLLGGVNYYTGQAFEMQRITEAAHRNGLQVGFDLAHAAGNLVLKLHDWDVDFAAWCSYKYLNAGPGSTGGCFIHERHSSNALLPRFAGWWGQDSQIRFLMGPEFSPIKGAEGWQLSNPPILPLAALRASMDIFDEAGFYSLRAKGDLLTGYLEYLLLNDDCPDWKIITPEDPNQRGSQLSIRIQRGGKLLFDYLTAHGVICDWREPDVIRVAPVPLYNSFTEVFTFARIFHEFFTLSPSGE